MICQVCKVSPAYSKGGVSYPTCRALTCASNVRKVPIASLNLPEYQILPPQTGILPSSASPSEISYSIKPDSVKGPNRSRRSAGQMKMCVVSATRLSSLLSLDFVDEFNDL